MNSASQDYELHLAELRQRLEHPTDYEHCITYFLEEFAGDMVFIQQSTAGEQPVLLSALEQIAGKWSPDDKQLEHATIFQLNDRDFIHGNAVVAGRALLFLYFHGINTGVAALIPGLNGAMEVARFKLPGGLPRPDLN